MPATPDLLHVLVSPIGCGSTATSRTGDAAFLAAINWLTVSQRKANQRYVGYNADEGDSGTLFGSFIAALGMNSLS